MHLESILGTINSYTKQRIEKALENYYEHEYLILAMVLSASAGGTIVGDSGLPLVTS
jgi:hypothetical protein